MAKYQVTMRHDEDTLLALSHMQYDLFCTRNRVARTFLSVALIAAGLSVSEWWSLLAIGYGCYLVTTTYASSNRTAHRIAEQLKESGQPFPCSVYSFEKNAMRITTQPDGAELDPLPYAGVLKLGEDRDAFYLFRDQYGGYRIPKQELGDREAAFKSFIEERTGKLFQGRFSPFERLRARLHERKAKQNKRNGQKKTRR